jgi:hypothetical protein
MATDTPTFSPPETVTIPGEAAIEALALLDAFAVVCDEFREDDAIDDFFNLQTGAHEPLARALPDPSGGMDEPPWYDAMSERSHEIQRELRQMLRGNDTLRLAALEVAVQKLGQEVIGVFWDDEKRRWLTPKAYFADVETTPTLVKGADDA